MEGKRNRGEVTAELSEKVWARLCRENALVASEVWVDDASRVDFVAYRPHRPLQPGVSWKPKGSSIRTQNSVLSVMTCLF